MLSESGTLTKRSTLLVSDVPSTMSDTSSKPPLRRVDGVMAHTHAAQPQAVPGSAKAAVPLAQLCRELSGDRWAGSCDARPHAPLMATLLHALIADCNADGAASLPLVEVCATFKVRM